MYNETGSKIKSWAIGSAVCGIFGYILLGIFSLFFFFISVSSSDSGYFPFVFLGGILLAIVGAVTAWRKYLLLAGFGELIEKTCELCSEVIEIKKSIVSQNGDASFDIVDDNINVSDENLPKWKLLKNCLDQGLITEEEFEKKMQEICK